MSIRQAKRIAPGISEIRHHSGQDDQDENAGRGPETRRGKPESDEGHNTREASTGRIGIPGVGLPHPGSFILAIRSARRGSPRKGRYQGCVLIQTRSLLL